MMHIFINNRDMCENSFSHMSSRHLNSRSSLSTYHCRAAIIIRSIRSLLAYKHNKLYNSKHTQPNSYIADPHFIMELIQSRATKYTTSLTQNIQIIDLDHLICAPMNCMTDILLYWLNIPIHLFLLRAISISQILTQNPD